MLAVIIQEDPKSKYSRCGRMIGSESTPRSADALMESVRGFRRGQLAATVASDRKVSRGMRSGTPRLLYVRGREEPIVSVSIRGQQLTSSARAASSQWKHGLSSVSTHSTPRYVTSPSTYI